VATQRRSLRPSGKLYGAIASANALTPAMLREYAPDTLAEIFPEYAHQTPVTNS
jgi:hypothetical protein